MLLISSSSLIILPWTVLHGSSPPLIEWFLQGTENCLLPYNVYTAYLPSSPCFIPGVILSTIRSLPKIGFAKKDFNPAFVHAPSGMPDYHPETFSSLHFADFSLEPDQPHEPFCLVPNCAILQSNVQYVERVGCLCCMGREFCFSLEAPLVFLPVMQRRSIGRTGELEQRLISWIWWSWAIGPLGASLSSYSLRYLISHEDTWFYK